MREIKFRKWHKELQDMTFWDGSKGSNNLFWHTLTEYPEMYSLMQFTGSVDRNGKEIYEGDIVTDGVGKYKIVYDLKLAGYQPYCIFRDEPENYCEVIGNIYENPDLVKL